VKYKCLKTKYVGSGKDFKGEVRRLHDDDVSDL
jgi:hypothetical protein